MAGFSGEESITVHPNAFRFADHPNAARFKPVEQANVEALAKRYDVDFCADCLAGARLAGTSSNGTKSNASRGATVH
jgi:hypothetical protein